MLTALSNPPAGKMGSRAFLNQAWSIPNLGVYDDLTFNSGKLRSLIFLCQSLPPTAAVAETAGGAQCSTGGRMANAEYGQENTKAYRIKARPSHSLREERISGFHMRLFLKFHPSWF